MVRLSRTTGQAARQSHSEAQHHRTNLTAVITASAAVATGAALYCTHTIIHNDAPAADTAQQKALSPRVSLNALSCSDDALHTLVWGSNK